MPENSPVGGILVYNRTNPLIFKTTDADEGLNGQVVYTWNSKQIRLHIHPATIILTTEFTDDSYNSVFALNKDTGEVTLAAPLNRSAASSYEVCLDNKFEVDVRNELINTTTVYCSGRRQRCAKFSQKRNQIED